MANVYILLSLKDKKTYTGSTNDLIRRIKEHKAGEVQSTKNRRPLKLIYKEKYKDLGEARKREKYLKTTSGRRELRRILENIIN